MSTSKGITPHGVTTNSPDRPDNGASTRKSSSRPCKQPLQGRLAFRTDPLANRSSASPQKGAVLFRSPRPLGPETDDLPRLLSCGPFTDYTEGAPKAALSILSPFKFEVMLQYSWLPFILEVYFRLDFKGPPPVRLQRKSSLGVLHPPNRIRKSWDKVVFDIFYICQFARIGNQVCRPVPSISVANSARVARIIRKSQASTPVSSSEREEKANMPTPDRSPLDLTPQVLSSHVL